MKYYLIILIPIIFSVLEKSYCQQNSVDSINFNRRKVLLYTTSGTLYTSSMLGLYSLWYKDYPSSNFHFFNDNNEWMQMDKLGHFTTSYFLGKIGIESLRWAGVKDRKAIWFGGSIGLLFLSNIEVFDGFSSNWGFSWGDMAANTLGAATVIGQELIWKEQRIKMKFSFHNSPYSKYNPDLLGNSITQNILKDYNGQTYWASVNAYSFLPKHSRLPKWLNIALGYGAEGMVGASTNPKQLNGSSIPDYPRFRQYYLSLDVDLTKINTKSKILKTIFTVTNFIKIPTPTFMITEQGVVKLYPIYF